MAGPIGPIDPDVPRDYQQPLSPQNQRPLNDYDLAVGPTSIQSLESSRNSSFFAKQKPQPPTYDDSNVDYYKQPSSPPYDYGDRYEPSLQQQNNDFNNDYNDYDYVVRVSLQEKRNKKRSVSSRRSFFAAQDASASRGHPNRSCALYSPSIPLPHRSFNT